MKRKAESDLTGLAQAGVLLPIDLHFGRTLERLCPTDDPWIPLVGALCSRAVQLGHVCLDLAHPPPLVGHDDQVVSLDWPSTEHWRTLLEASAAVSDGSRATPLVLSHGHRLYLQRYHRYEERLARALKRRVESSEALSPLRAAALLDRHFGSPDRAGTVDLQREAVRLALGSRLAVISGGPGTGKTWTVARLLLILTELALEAGKAPRVALLAPTGKAAQRLRESIAKALEGPDVSADVKASISSEAATIHRALGYQPRSPTRFFRNGKNPLPEEVVIVDEASMIDLALMTKLVEAVAPSARLVLLGDKDQLASVEAGAILGDILRAPLPGCSVELVESRRYGESSGIGELARALRERDTPRAHAALEHGNDVHLVELAGDQRALESAIAEGFREYGHATTPEERLSALDRFRLLSAHRGGPRGVLELNALCERVLARSTPLDPRPGPYEGQPISITNNDYALELWNGDVGVLGPNRDGTRLVAYFRKDSELRSVPLSRLPAHETVFAMTVHKSQGSEFDRVALVLPAEPSPLLTRELLYTAVTRAKRAVTLFGSRDILDQGILHGLSRSSGLAERLHMGAGLGSTA